MKRLLGLMLLMVVLVGCGEADAPPVTALKKLGAGIQRNAQSEIDQVSLFDTQVTDAGMSYSGWTTIRGRSLSEFQEHE